MQVFLQHRNDSGIEILEPKNSKSIGRSNSTASNKSTATLGARSTLSTLCEPSPTIEPAIVIHQADTGIVRNRPWSGVWEPLVDDDAWTATSTRDETANSPHWTPLQTWNANSSSWSARRSHQRGGGNKRPWYTRKVCLTCGAGIVLACLFVTLILIMFVHWGPRFDPTTGATGSSPQSAPGPPPPVKGILSSTVSLNTTSIYFGASIDWKTDDPLHFGSQLNFSVSIYDSVFYLSKNLVVAGNVNSSGIIHYVDDLFFWTANLIRGSGAIMSITLIPTVPMANIEQSAFAQVVEKCQMINAMGVAVMLNFAPSMNGNWYPYGQSPRAYLQAFQLLSNLVQNGTNQTAMVWSPSAQLGYPFVGGRYSSNSSEIRSLDTNGNGLLDGGDDPYLPYYPGDKFVDWVGFSAYYTSPPGNSTIYPILSDYESQLSQETSLPTTTSPLTPVPTLAPFVNVDPRNQSVADQPTFESLLTSPRTNFNLYRDFSLARRKPFVVSSTGAGFYAGNGDVTELQVKSSWYGQIFNSTLLTNYEYIRAIVVQNNVFSLANTNLGVGLYKPSNLVNTVSLDFSISNPAVRQSFTALVSTLINQKMVSNRTRIASS